MKNSVVLNVVLILALCVVPVVLFAQAPGFGGGDVTDTPIDGGISLLVAAGIGYGVKKVVAKRKADKENTNK